MKKIVIGMKNNNKHYDFRETCFGIVYKDNKFYLTEKNGEISLIGGGLEGNETHEDTLKREFLEEAGLEILGTQEFVTIDCYWITRNGKHMNSLAHFYIVNVSDAILTPVEKESKLVILDVDDAIKEIVLPYQKEGLKLFINRTAK